MAYSVDPKTSGEGIHRFLLGTAILQCIEDRHDEVRFSTSVEIAVDIAADLILKQRDWWHAAMAKILVTDEGHPIYSEKGELLRPGADISKESRHRQLGALMVLARNSDGIFSRRSTPYDEASLEFFLQQTKGDAQESDPTEAET